MRHDRTSVGEALHSYAVDPAAKTRRMLKRPFVSTRVSFLVESRPASTRQLTCAGLRGTSAQVVVCGVVDDSTKRSHHASMTRINESGVPRGLALICEFIFEGRVSCCVIRN